MEDLLLGGFAGGVAVGGVGVGRGLIPGGG